MYHNAILQGSSMGGKPQKAVDFGAPIPEQATRFQPNQKGFEVPTTGHCLYAKDEGRVTVDWI